ERVPKVLATHPAWHGWLTLEFPGHHLDQCPENCELASETLARLQIASREEVDALLTCGCRDLRGASLLPMIDPFLKVMGEQMAMQEKMQPAPLCPTELSQLGEWLKEALTEWTALPVPDTLGHLDFNPGNVLCSSERCIFLDWAEAYVGPPFMTIE